MSHYRKIDVKIWNDEKFISLSAEGKLAFFMLLTHPMMTALGAMRGTPGGLADELCCGSEAKREAFREGLRDIIDLGMAEYDERSSLICLPNFVKYNPPESPNVVKAWNKCLDFLPDGPLKTLTIQRAKAYAEGLSKGFREAIPDTVRKSLSKTSPNQRTENREHRTENMKDGSEGERLSPAPAHTRDDVLVDQDEYEALKANGYAASSRGV